LTVWLAIEVLCQALQNDMPFAASITVQSYTPLSLLSVPSETPIRACPLAFAFSPVVIYIRLGFNLQGFARIACIKIHNEEEVVVFRH
jgi:hypothetical protein